jgi:hypothetical protein
MDYFMAIKAKGKSKINIFPVMDFY